MKSVRQFWSALQDNAGAMGVLVSGGAALAAGAWTVASLRKEIEIKGKEIEKTELAWKQEVEKTELAWKKEIEMKGKEIEKTELAWKKEIEKTELAYKKEVAEIRAEYLGKLLDLGFHGDYEKYRATIQPIQHQPEQNQSQ